MSKSILKRYSIIFLLSLYVIGCETADEQFRRDQEIKQEIKDHFQYYQDKQTKLCFAYYGIGYSSGLLTNVPCTPEVLNWIDRNNEIFEYKNGH